MNKTIVLTGIALGTLAVLLDAFGAHGLENLVAIDSIQSFEIGVRYQMYHALFLLVLGSAVKLPEQSKKPIYYLIVSGVVLFSFSIYALVTNKLTPFDFRAIGFVTPIGGLLLILGWVLTGYQLWLGNRLSCPK